MSDEKFQSLDRTLGLATKIVISVVLTIFGYVAMKTHESSEKWRDEMTHDIKSINSKLFELNQKVNRLENFNEFEEKQRAIK